jgi:hypothetical protein
LDLVLQIILGTTLHTIFSKIETICSIVGYQHEYREGRMGLIPKFKGFQKLTELLHMFTYLYLDMSVFNFLRIHTKENGCH